MRVTLLKKNPNTYSCNVYYVRGNWNAIDDVNTMIDVGTNEYALNEVSKMESTGVGKRKIEQIILTHEHFDHAGGLKFILQKYKPDVIAYSKIPGVTRKAYNNMHIKVGDQFCRLIHTPGHSHDSICVYCEEEKVLFSGDTALNIKTPGGSYSKEYVDALIGLSELKVETIFSGHDDPVFINGWKLIENTLNNVLKSKVID
jgi:glyoxylase-like metal-dependent hydrolase (beta-lactamase superfamily II)